MLWGFFIIPVDIDRKETFFLLLVGILTALIQSVLFETPCEHSQYIFIAIHWSVRLSIKPLSTKNYLLQFHLWYGACYFLLLEKQLMIIDE